ncbi:MAG: ABC transporter [Desulfobacteraceae bacterium 4572_130]|nr:MAG: ABC transporter [Desulfobacteraceae bacterium 4572_130]
MIKINSVTKNFKSGIKKSLIKAVNELSFNIHKNKTLGIIGPNGAGKTSLLKMILGFIKPDKGFIEINEKSPMDYKSRGKTGYLPENPYYYDNLTLNELFLFSFQITKTNKYDFKKRADYLLKKTGLLSVRKAKLSSYSKGMLQKAGICLALINNPDLIIFDEPTSGLDPIARKILSDIILDLKNKNKTIIICSHILNDIEKLCDQIIIMADGKIKAKYLKKDLVKNKTDLEQVFIETVM